MSVEIIQQFAGEIKEKEAERIDRSKGGSSYEEILRQFIEELKAKEAEWIDRLKKELSYEEIEREILNLVNDLFARLAGSLLAEVLEDEEILKRVRQFGGKLAYRFVRYQDVTVRLANGKSLKVRSPYFVKAKPKRGPKKRGPNGRGCHLLLELLGFMGRCSVLFASEVVQMALLCPSFAVAHEVLSLRGISVDVKTIRRLCGMLGEFGLDNRGVASLEAGESVAGKTVVIGTDGGRLRLRQKKRGRKAAGLKRQGYNTPWREPRLLTIYVLDDQGRVEKSCRPLHDATLGDADETFVLLAEYLRNLQIQKARCVIFTGDGSPWIWNRVQPLLEDLSLDPERVFQVVDYFHAVSRLWVLLELREDLAPKERMRVYKQWKSLLWRGDIAGLKAAVMQMAKGKARKKMLKRLEYFETHAHRMQYQSFKAQNIPQGSGCVESAIRRVINLRLKAPGTFWTSFMAEYFLFLRSQLLSGRWSVFMTNVARRRRSQWSDIQETASDPMAASQYSGGSYSITKAAA